MNYDWIVNLDDERKLCLKYFFDSSLTFCELFLLLIFYVSYMKFIFTTLHYAPCFKEWHAYICV